MLAVAYFRGLRYRPGDPHWEERDRFLLSIGHYAIALYAALIEAGILPEDELETYGSDESRLPMSAMASYTPGMEISSGSLGHGLPLSIGFCLALKRKKSKSFVYCLFSDGELDEGSVWEAAMSAGHWKLDNLIAIVDVSNMQADGPSTQMLGWPWSPSSRRSGGTCNGRRQRHRRPGHGLRCGAQPEQPRPRIIICDTKMAKGVPFLETREMTHFLRVERDEWAKALDVLDAGRPA